MKKLTSHCWWFDSHNNTNTKRSPWLQSTLAELEGKTQAMLKVIEEDADSFAQRAEMYYKKRPELINMVQDFYRAHRSLAEQYDLAKLDTGNRVVSPWRTLALSNTKSQLARSISVPEKTYDSYSDAYELEESDESEVDDSDPEEGLVVQIHIEDQNIEVSGGVVVDDEATKLKEEIERLKLENSIQREQLVEKDEEKREVIRQLSLAMDMLREENLKLRENSKSTTTPKKQNSMEFNKLKEGFWKKLFNGSQTP
ncbi:hypothetical protein LIER_37153 [Lithospermum erythrorhizon]|uniref:NAB domain-containing protein n=1 Tax=Lithospermum erythrorhizon TaxID=34254 RepID=A0AAV3PHP3_LITER